jgi:hypothetical protein
MSAPTSLTEYAVLQSIETLPVVGIEPNAFYNCNKLQRISLGGNIKTIGAYAFYGCTALNDIDLSGVTSIGQWAFGNCRALADVTLGGGLKAVDTAVFYGCTALSRLTLSEGITSIGDSAFYNTGLSAAEIPSTVKTIGNAAFGSCKALKSVAIKASVPPALIGSPFFNTSNTFYVIVSDGSLAAYSSQWSGLGATIIGRSDIVDDYIVAGDGDGYKIILYIGQSLDAVVPKQLNGRNVTAIGRYAFNSAVKSVTLPETVTRIESFAFKDSEALLSLTLRAETPPELGVAVFWDADDRFVIYVPQKSVTAYMSANKWFFNADIIKGY